MPEQIPTIKIPAWVRFTLYLAGAIALQLSSYFLDKGVTWWGDGEVKLTNGIVGLVALLAAGKTTADAVRPTSTTIQGELVDRVDETNAGVIEGGY